MTELTPLGAAFLSSRHYADKFGDMSADEIEALSFAEYAARTGREFGVTEPVKPPGGPVPAPVHPGQDPQAVADAQHPGTDFRAMGMSEYRRVRD